MMQFKLPNQKKYDLKRFDVVSLCLELDLGLGLGLGLGSGLWIGLGSLNCNFENNIRRHLLNVFNDFQLPIFINIILFFLYLKWFAGLFYCLRIFINSLQVFPIP